MVQHMLFLQRIGNLRGLTGKVEVLANGLLRGRPASESVVVEGIVGIVEAVAESIIRLIKVDAAPLVSKARQWWEAQHTHHRRLPLHSGPQKHRAVQTQVHLPDALGRGADWCQSRRMTWWARPVKNSSESVAIKQKVVDAIYGLAQWRGEKYSQREIAPTAAAQPDPTSESQLPRAPSSPCLS